jgi:hypothetical protein
MILRRKSTDPRESLASKARYGRLARDLPWAERLTLDLRAEGPVPAPGGFLFFLFPSPAPKQTKTDRPGQGLLNSAFIAEPSETHGFIEASTTSGDRQPWQHRPTPPYPAASPGLAVHTSWCLANTDFRTIGTHTSIQKPKAQALPKLGDLIKV